jgi:hypothetical protein
MGCFSLNKNSKIFTKKGIKDYSNVCLFQENLRKVKFSRFSDFKAAINHQKLADRTLFASKIKSSKT